MRNAESLGSLFAQMMNSHDAGRFRELVSHGSVNNDPHLPPGRNGLIGVMRQGFAGIVDTRVTVDDVLVAGESVIGRSTDKGRHTGPFMGMPPSGADITVRSLDIWRIRDGLLVEHWDELTTPEVLHQMGAVDVRGDRP